MGPRNWWFMWKYRRRRVPTHVCADKMFRNAMINIKHASRVAFLELKINALEFQIANLETRVRSNYNHIYVIQVELDLGP